MNSFFKDYFTLSRSERNAIYLVIGLMVFLIVLNFFLPYLKTPEKSDFSKFEKDVNEFKNKLRQSDSFRSKYDFDYRNENPILDEINTQTAELFDFNPNTLSIEQWRLLSVPDKQIKIIQNFLKKGGHFYKKEDLKKIYGFDLELYHKLESYIKIPQNKSLVKKDEIKKIDHNKIDYKPGIVELNNADPDLLDKLPGIGPGFASKIVKYRTLLGGYFVKEQLMEVYGFDTVLYNKIISYVEVDPKRIVKIPINLANISQLAKHPYIGYELAKKIITYRNKQGPFKSLTELKNREIIKDESKYSKIIPYLCLWE
jgi:competence protein ComEA